jgi:hypothetical protein
MEALSLYARLPLMLVMWALWPRDASPSPAATVTSATVSDEQAPLLGDQAARRTKWLDWVDIHTVDLRADEFDEDVVDEVTGDHARSTGWKARAKTVYKWIA